MDFDENAVCWHQWKTSPFWTINVVKKVNGSWMKFLITITLLHHYWLRAQCPQAKQHSSCNIYTVVYYNVWEETFTLEAAAKQSTTFSNKPGGLKHFMFSDVKMSNIWNYNLGFHILQLYKSTSPWYVTLKKQQSSHWMRGGSGLSSRTFILQSHVWCFFFLLRS